LWRTIYTEQKGEKEEVLLRKMPNGVEPQASQPGQLERYRKRNSMPILREAFHCDKRIRASTKILLPRLRKQR